MMISENRLIGAILTLLGIVTMIWVVPDAADEFGGYEDAAGANLLPMAAMAVFTGLAILLFVLGGKRKTEENEPDWSMSVHDWAYLFLLASMLFLYLGCFNFFGFIPAGIICIAAFMLLMGQRNVLAILLTSTLLPVGFYFILRHLLNISFS